LNLFAKSGLISSSGVFMKLFAKYASPVVFFAIIWATQFLSTVDKDMDLEQHVQVQQELSSIIADYVKKNLPEMTNFKMLSVYTKAPHKGKVQAYFNYSFETPTKNTNQVAVTQLFGHATLQKIKNDPAPEWALNAIDMEGEDVTFTEPMIITPSKDTPAAKEQKDEESKQ
jgi:hypothetical protein